MPSPDQEGLPPSNGGRKRKVRGASPSGRGAQGPHSLLSFGGPAPLRSASVAAGCCTRLVAPGVGLGGLWLSWACCPPARPFSQSRPVRWPGCSARARLAARASPRSALPPVRGSWWFGPSGRRRRSPPGSAGRPAPARPFAGSRPCSAPGFRSPRSARLPPALLRPLAWGPGGLCRGRRAWPPFGGWRPWCGCAARGFGARPGPLLLLRPGFCSVGPGAWLPWPPLLSHDKGRPGLRAGPSASFDSPKKVKPCDLSQGERGG